MKPGEFSKLAKEKYEGTLIGTMLKDTAIGAGLGAGAGGLGAAALMALGSLIATKKIKASDLKSIAGAGIFGSLYGSLVGGEAGAIAGAVEHTIRKESKEKSYKKTIAKGALIGGTTGAGVGAVRGLATAETIHNIAKIFGLKKRNPKTYALAAAHGARKVIIPSIAIGALMGLFLGEADK